MKPHEILLLGLNNRVTAFGRADGTVLWITKLEGAAGQFISMVCDARQVFATCRGVLHCLDLQTGEILWKDPLKGYGYGIGSLCLPEQGVSSAGGAAAYLAAQASAAAASTTVTQPT